MLHLSPLEPPGMGDPSNHAEIIRCRVRPRLISSVPNDDDAHHLQDWLDAMRARKPPSATVDHGFPFGVLHDGGRIRTGKESASIGMPSES